MDQEVVEEQGIRKGAMAEEVLMGQVGVVQGWVMVEEHLRGVMDLRPATAMAIRIHLWEELLQAGTCASSQLQVMADDPRQGHLQHLVVTVGSHRQGLRQLQEDMVGSRQDHLRRLEGMGGSHLLARYQHQQTLADGLLQALHRQLEDMLLMDHESHLRELRG